MSLSLRRLLVKIATHYVTASLHALHLTPNFSGVSSSEALSNGNRNAVKDAEVKEAGGSPSPDDPRYRNYDRSSAIDQSLCSLG